MPSNLHNKINSYAIERGISMDEAWSVSPTRTGTNPIATFTTNTGTKISYSTDGPIGGNGSWSVPYNITTANNGFLTNTTASTTELLGIFDNDWSIGFWFKIPVLPPATANTAVSLLTLGGGGQGGVIINITGSAHATNPSQLMFDTANNFTYNGTTINANTWYYLAVTRAGSGNNNHKIYLNGTEVKTFYDPGTGTTQQTFTIGSSAARGSNGTFYISNYYLAPTSVIGPTQIAEIWSAGSTLPRTVKYFNGTSWVNSSAQKVWNGTAWVDWNAKRFDGSAWVNV